jgi:hypothetical protein
MSGVCARSVCPFVPFPRRIERQQGRALCRFDWLLRAVRKPLRREGVSQKRYRQQSECGLWSISHESRLSLSNIENIHPAWRLVELRAL